MIIKNLEDGDAKPRSGDRSAEAILCHPFGVLRALIRGHFIILSPLRGCFLKCGRMWTLLATTACLSDHLARPLPPLVSFTNGMRGFLTRVRIAGEQPRRWRTPIPCQSRRDDMIIKKHDDE